MGMENSHRNIEKKEENDRPRIFKESMPGSEFWTDGLICAFEYVRVHKSTKPRSPAKVHGANKAAGEKIKKPVATNRTSEGSSRKTNGNNLVERSGGDSEGQGIVPLDEDTDNLTHAEHFHTVERPASHWVPIGWARISELLQAIEVDDAWSSPQLDDMVDEDDLTVADLAAPYWERAVGRTWWCHVAAGHPFIDTWLKSAQWLHPAIRTALIDESRLISDRMKHLLYEVPVRVAGGILFELLGQSVGDPFVDEDDVPIVLRCWQAQNFLITALHIKGSASNINILGITEVQEMLAIGGHNSPRSIHEVIAHLTSRLARWDDRLFRKSIFGAADEVELKFINRRNHEDLNLLSIILNQEIRRLTRQVIRVKWSLHAREEIVYELLQLLRGPGTRGMLDGLRKNTREMIEEQEAVRGRLFTIQDVMQSTVRAWLQDRSLRVTHNLAVFGGCGLVLSIFTGLFGINVDGIPGSQNTPYAFGLFTGILLLLGIVLIGVGLIYLGLKQPISEEQVEVRKLELQQLVTMFQHEAETHAQVRSSRHRQNLPPTPGDIFLADADYILIR